MTEQLEPQPAVSAPAVVPIDSLFSPQTSVGQAMVGVDHASVMGMELIAAVLLWTGLGYLLDRWLGTGPWLLVIGGIIGNAAGITLIWFRSKRMDDVERLAAASRRAGHRPPEGGPGAR